MVGIPGSRPGGRGLGRRIVVRLGAAGKVPVGPHLLNVQYNIRTGEKFAGAKVKAVELGKAFAAKLR